MAVDMWSNIRSKQPDAKLIQLLGNHDDRLKKRCQERLPEAQELIKLSTEELYTFDGVHTVFDSREEYRIGDIMLHHGYKTALGAHTKFTGFKFSHGHTHRGGVLHIPFKDDNLWELDCGHLADYDQEPMRYREQNWTNSTMGWGEISEIQHNTVPFFIPLKR